MKKLFFLCMTVLLLVGCSKNDNAGLPNENGTDGSYAPESILNKSIAFYKDNKTQWFFKVLFGQDEDHIITSSQYAIVSNASADYIKTGNNTAQFDCYFITNYTIGGNEIGSWNQYEFQLTFLSPNHGKYVGKAFKNPEDTEGEPRSGMFVYDSEKGIDSFVDIKEQEKIDITLLTKSIWKSTENDCKRYFSFGKDYSFKHYWEADGAVDKIKGEYEFNDDDNTIQLYTDSDYELFDFKILKLSTSEVWLSLYDPMSDEYPSSPTMKLKAVSEGDDVPSFITDSGSMEVSISTPTIENISTNKATVKGKIYGNDDKHLSEIGVCYSTKQNPTINDNYVTTTSNSVNVELKGLTSNTTYYVRIYVKHNKDVQYGNVTSFTTEKSSSAEDNTKESDFYIRKIETRYSDYNYLNDYYDDIYYATLWVDYYDEDDDEKRYVGLCYSTTPNPKITDYTTDFKIAGSNYSLNNLKAGTTYYVRPYQVIGSKAVYYEETSFETIGNNMQISAELSSNYEKVTGQYSINMEGTYKISYRFIDYVAGNSPYHLIKYAEKSKGDFEFSVGKDLYKYFERYEIAVECIETGLSYLYHGKLGKEYGN